MGYVYFICLFSLYSSRPQPPHNLNLPAKLDGYATLRMSNGVTFQQNLKCECVTRSKS